MNKLLLVCSFLLLATNYSFSQAIFPINDVRDDRNELYALTNATIVIDYQTTLENATLLIEGDFITQVGQNITIPKGYSVIDVASSYIYPSFIDIYTSYGLKKDEKPVAAMSWTNAEQIESLTKGAYNGNEAIKSEYDAASEFSVDQAKAKELRDLGFGAVVSFRADGLARGSASLACLSDESDNKALISTRASANYSFTKGSSKQLYPISPMGFIAVLRQTYLNAEWFSSQNPAPFSDLSLENWISLQSLPQIFDTNGWIEILRADRLGDEFGVQYIIKGSGNEYQRIAEIKATSAQLIIPINYPDAYDVDDAFDAKNVSLKEMKHWEMAPTNAAQLADNNIEFSFTAAGLKSKSSFIPNIKKAIKHGLSEEDALKSLTHTPASMINESDRLGSLKKGHFANLLIVSKPIFSDDAVILENWVQGKRYIIKSLDKLDFAGIYELDLNGTKYQLEVNDKPYTPKAKFILSDTSSIPIASHFNQDLVDFTFQAEDTSGYIRLSGWAIENGWKGKGQLVNGEWIEWTAARTGDFVAKEKKKEEALKDSISIGQLIFPFTAFGNTELPQQETILIKNATLWTNEAEGILEETDILLENGKIKKIGKNLKASNAKEIDASGKHVSCGIIDEHSHIALSAVNDIATNSSMVRLNDVVNSEDNNVYYALSGGVTVAQLLHGSANPIGGQSAFIKLRWGVDPEGMKLKKADPFIKFALGENVKRDYNSNSIRYPQSRMGVEQVFMDAFSSALDYNNDWKKYSGLDKSEKAKSIKPRKDLAMETMLEIINGERFITCHSYVQSEIIMLMNVAEKFDFRINTFTHILEGYKVADRMMAHGVGASTFSDWWAYKWEVRYAIPYNAAIMHNAGLVVALNSDDPEMGRRLNQEAAKTIKYGGLSQEDAWKTVTLNPAKLLHLDEFMGSLKEGKDADVVIWSSNPLSIYTKAETTIIDGTIYFDLNKDIEMKDWVEKERARLIQKMKSSKKNGASVQSSNGSKRKAFHCDDLTINSTIQTH